MSFVYLLSFSHSLILSFSHDACDEARRRPIRPHSSPPSTSSYPRHHGGGTRVRANSPRHERRLPRHVSPFPRNAAVMAKRGNALSPYTCTHFYSGRASYTRVPPQSWLDVCERAEATRGVA